MEASFCPLFSVEIKLPFDSKEKKICFSQDFCEEFQRQLNEATSRGYGGGTLAIDWLAINKLFGNFTIRGRNVL
jgi:hypothetical protein